MTPPILAILRSLVGHRSVWLSITCLCADRNTPDRAEVKVRDAGNLFDGPILLIEISEVNAQVAGCVCRGHQFLVVENQASE
jgi:hypothetical protein